MTSEKKPDSNVYALERTHMAAERTYFSVLRTGLAIAGAGTVVVGYTMIIVTLNNYQKIVNNLEIERKLNVMSPRLTIFLTAVLQLGLVVVFALFVIGLFAD